MAQRILPVWLNLALVLVLAVPVLAVRAPRPEDRVQPDFDSRTGPVVPPDPSVLAALEALEGRLGISIPVRFNPLNGGVRLLTGGNGPLSIAVNAPGRDIAQAFLNENFVLMGLSQADLSDFSVARDYSGHNEAVTHVLFEQAADGVEVYGSAVGIHVNQDGQIVYVSSSAVRVANRAIDPTLSAETALILAAADIRPELTFDPIALDDASGPDRAQAFDKGPFKSDFQVRLVHYPVRGGTLLAWLVQVEPEGFPQNYTVLVDAANGDILFRTNHVRYAEGVGNVLQSNATQAIDPRLPDEHPAGDGASGPGDPPNGCPPINNFFNRSLNNQFMDPATVLFAGGDLSGNNGASYRQTTGNFGALGTLVGDVWQFNYSFNTADFAETHLFFEMNFVHDFFYDLGFDEASGNFQEDNFGRGGLGSDGLNANARAPGRNNANFSTPPDGSNPTMNMFLWDGVGCWQEDVDGDGTQDLDGTIDNDIVIHEYHHGVTFRLNTQWGGNEGGAMGEGGGDFFAYSVNGDTELGEYAAPPIGIRQVNSKTYGDWFCLFGFFCQVHTNGEIWANTLWDIRQRFIADNVGGSQDAAINEVHQLYVNGIKLSPPQPTMLEMRDSMLQDDLNRNPNGGVPGGSENYCRMWEAFAGRGMGTGATDTKDSGNNTVSENFDIPAACLGPVDPPDGDPSGLTATAVSSSQIDLAWTDGSTNEDGFSIERCTGSGCSSFVEIDTVGANVTSYNDTGLAASTTYNYRVRAFNGGGNSGYSNEAEDTTDASTGPPAAPSDLTATVTSSGKGKNKTFLVDLAWTDNSNNEDEFEIERCTETGKGKNKTCTFVFLASVGANVTAYQDAPSKGTYKYRVRANAGGNSSAYSNEVTVKLN